MWKIIAIALTAFLFASATATAKDRPMVGFTSFGSAQIGMSAEQLEATLGTALIRMDPDSGDDICYYVAPAADKLGVSFMLINGHLARIDVSRPGISTLSGATVGMSQQQVLQLYGPRIHVSPHAYIAPDGSYLTVPSPDKKYGVRFETDAGRVTSYYAGTAEAIEYIEHCL
jgi:hypothetical protein